MNQQSIANEIFNDAADAMTLIDSMQAYLSHIEEETDSAEANHANRLAVMINSRLSNIVGNADRLQTSQGEAS